MSIFIPIKSVCGAVTSQIDIYDLELNQDGIICCDNCKSILVCRESWYKKFNYK